MNIAVDWKIYTYEELTSDDLYAILNLRARVFIVEQNSAYLDPDGKDKCALHLCGFFKDSLIAYCRIFKRGMYFEEASIGRVVTDKNYRASGIGKTLMEKAIQLEKTVYGEETIVISAQLYLQGFYESLGFVRISDVYIEDTIEHVRMKYDRS